MVAPRAGAWIETSTRQEIKKRLLPSHPVRVRGLKLIEMQGFPKPEVVAPRAGAWIETIIEEGINGKILLRRTPCGCVD